MFAQHLFSAFMHAVANTAEPKEPFQESASVQPNAGNMGSWKSFALRSTKLSAMARDIENAGFGALEDVYLSIIPPLSEKQKLPRADAIVDLAREQAKPYEKLGLWSNTFNVYVWLFRTAISFPVTGITTKATTILMEFLRKVSSSIALRTSGDELGPDEEELEEFKVNLENMLEKHADQNVLSGLMFLYKKQQRKWQCAFIREEEARPRQRKSILKMLGFTPLHDAAQQGDESDDNDLTTCLQNGAHQLNVRDATDWTALHYATAAGSSPIVRRLLYKGADANAHDLGGFVPLHYACLSDPTKPEAQGLRPELEQIIARLIERGADVNAQGRDGTTPLHWAATAGDEMAVSALIEAGANADIQDAHGKTPLFCAIQERHGVVAKTLFQVSNKRLRSNDGRTLSHVAALAGETLIAEWLYSEGAFDTETKDRRTERPLHLAARAGHTGMVALLFQKDTEVNVKGKGERTPLHLAAQHGHAETVRWIIKHGGEKEAINHRNYTPLHLAAESGHTETVALLIEKGAKVNVKDIGNSTPLHWAAESGHTETVGCLVEKGAEKELEAREVSGTTPLYLAAANGHAGTVACLIKKGADKEAKDSSGRTPLAVAVWRELENVVRSLVGAGAKIDVASDSLLPWTALGWGAYCGNKAIVEILLDAGAEVDILDDEGHTPLMLVIEGQKNGTKTLDLLVKRGAEVNYKDRAGHTPLHLAGRKRALWAVEPLLKKGANKSSRNDDGQTPLEVAMDRRQAIIDRGYGMGLFSQTDRAKRMREEEMSEYNGIIALLE